MSEKRDDTNKPIVEDWTMSAPQTVKTAAAQAKNDDWKMPEPVFRVSDGTPFGNAKSETKPSIQPPAAEQIIKKETGGLEIQPQPYLPEELDINQITRKKPAEAESGIPRVIFGVFGILVMALFALAFLIGVYFLFFYKSLD